MRIEGFVLAVVAAAAGRVRVPGRMLRAAPGGGGLMARRPSFRWAVLAGLLLACRGVAAADDGDAPPEDKCRSHPEQCEAGAPSAQRPPTETKTTQDRAKDGSTPKEPKRPAAKGREEQDAKARLDALAPYFDFKKDPKVLKELLGKGVTLPAKALSGVPPGYKVRVRAFGNCPDPSSCRPAIVIGYGHGDAASDYASGDLQGAFKKMAAGLRPGELALVVSPIASGHEWPGSRGPKVGKAYADTMTSVAAAAGNPKAPFVIAGGSGGGQGFLFPLIQHMASDPGGAEFAKRLSKIVDSEALFAYPDSARYRDLVKLLNDNPALKLDTYWGDYEGRYRSFSKMLEQGVDNATGRITFERAGNHWGTFGKGVGNLLRGVDLHPEEASGKLSVRHVGHGLPVGALPSPQAVESLFDR